MTITLHRGDFSAQLLADARDGLRQYRMMLGRELAGEVLDIGAHHGAFALSAVEAGAEYVLAVEAAQTNFKALLDNVVANRMEHKVVAIHAAVYGMAGGTVTLRRAIDGNSGQHSLVFHEGHPVSDDAVRAISFIALLQTRRCWSYVKIDIEGGEWSFLAGPDDAALMLEHTTFLDLEVHPLDAPEYYTPVPTHYVDEVAEWFREAGGRVAWSVHHPTRLFVASDCCHTQPCKRDGSFTGLCPLTRRPA